MDLMIYKPFSKKEQPLNLSLSQKKKKSFSTNHVFYPDQCQLQGEKTCLSHFNAFIHNGAWKLFGFMFWLINLTLRFKFSLLGLRLLSLLTSLWSTHWKRWAWHWIQRYWIWDPWRRNREVFEPWHEGEMVERNLAELETSIRQARSTAMIEARKRALGWIEVHQMGSLTWSEGIIDAWLNYVFVHQMTLLACLSSTLEIQRA